MKLYKSQEEAEKKYKEYIEHHKQNVMDAFNLLATLDIPFINENKDKIQEICSVHDDSKFSDNEFFPYLHHFYPTTKEEAKLEDEFDNAVMLHVLNNRHHWNCKDWIDPETGNLKGGFDENLYKIHTVERCCDWLAMAYQHGEKPTEWWNANKETIKMPDYAVELTDEILNKVPEDFKLSHTDVRGSLDESELLNKLHPRIEDDISDKKIVSYYKRKILNGEHRPILISKDNEVIDGNHTMTAYKELGVEPEQVYLGTSEDFLKTAAELSKNHNSDNLGLDSVYKMIKDGTAKLVEEIKVLKGSKGFLIEATMGQLKKKTISEDPTRAKKSKNVQSKYLGISKYGVLNFETTSETHSGVKWYQEIQFPSFQGFMNIVQQGDTIDADDVKRAMQSDNLKLSCDDPSFLYWAWKYMAWKDVYGLDKETRAPKRNNTRLQGGLCKHLYSVIELVNERRIIDLIARDLNEWCRRQLGMENQGYQDAEGMMNKDFKADQYDYNIEDVLKDLLTQENFNKYMDGTPLEDLGLSQEEINDIDDAIKHMRDSSQYALRTELEKQLAPAKRGRKITREDKKLQVTLKSDREEEV